MTKTAELRQQIAETFIAALDAGTIPWRRPWARAGRSDWQGHHNAATGRPYSGINPMLLEIRALREGWETRGWMTFKQAKAAGGSVIKGSKGTQVVFWKMLKVDDDGEEKTVPLLKHFVVFNVSQIEGLAERIEPQPEEEEAAEFDPVEVAESIVGNMPSPPSIRHAKQDNAFYLPAADAVTMPERGQFTHAPGYYSTLFHELAHATGHESRLNRPTLTGGARFGSREYAREELVAEITAGYLCAESGIGDEVIGNQTAYVQHWAAKIKSDPDMVLWAAGQASKAADRILGL